MSCDKADNTRHWFGECRTCQWCTVCNYFQKGCELGAHCRSGCPTQDHESWGACARAANMRVAYCGIGGGDATAQKAWDTDLSLYRQARAQGIHPDGTTRNKVTQALVASDAAGAAYGKDFSKATPMLDGAA